MIITTIILATTILQNKRIKALKKEITKDEKIYLVIRQIRFQNEVECSV